MCYLLWYTLRTVLGALGPGRNGLSKLLAKSISVCFQRGEDRAAALDARLGDGL